MTMTPEQEQTARAIMELVHKLDPQGNWQVEGTATGVRTAFYDSDGPWRNIAAKNLGAVLEILTSGTDDAEERIERALNAKIEKIPWAVWDGR